MKNSNSFDGLELNYLRTVRRNVWIFISILLIYFFSFGLPDDEPTWSKRLGGDK